VAGARQAAARLRPFPVAPVSVAARGTGPCRPLPCRPGQGTDLRALPRRLRPLPLPPPYPAAPAEATRLVIAAAAVADFWPVPPHRGISRGRCGAPNPWRPSWRPYTMVPTRDYPSRASSRCGRTRRARSVAGWRPGRSRAGLRAAQRPGDLPGVLPWSWQAHLRGHPAIGDDHLGITTPPQTRPSPTPPSITKVVIHYPPQMNIDDHLFIRLDLLSGPAGQVAPPPIGVPGNKSVLERGTPVGTPGVSLAKARGSAYQGSAAAELLANGLTLTMEMGIRGARSSPDSAIALLPSCQSATAGIE
jgi:ribosomal protein S14